MSKQSNQSSIWYFIRTSPKFSQFEKRENKHKWKVVVLHSNKGMTVKNTIKGSTELNHRKSYRSGDQQCRPDTERCHDNNPERLMSLNDFGIPQARIRTSNIQVAKSTRILFVKKISYPVVNKRPGSHSNQEIIIYPPAWVTRCPTGQNPTNSKQNNKIRLSRLDLDLHVYEQTIWFIDAKLSI